MAVFSGMGYSNNRQMNREKKKGRKKDKEMKEQFID